MDPLLLVKVLQCIEDARPDANWRDESDRDWDSYFIDRGDDEACDKIAEAVRGIK